MLLTIPLGIADMILPLLVTQVANIRQGMDLGLMLTGVPLVVLSRAVNIYPLSYLVNKGGLAHTLAMHTHHMSRAEKILIPGPPSQQR